MRSQQLLRNARVPDLILLGLIASTLTASGQTTTCTDGPKEAFDNSNSSVSSDYDRPVSWKLLVPNILCDQKKIWLFPLEVTHDHNWIPALSFAGATAGLMAFDPIEGRYFHQTSIYSGFNNVFTSTATEVATILAPTSLYLAGWVRRDSKMQRTALLAGEAVADTEIVATVLKDVTSRERPYSYSAGQNYADSFYDHSGSKVIGGGGFPSGHTIAAFAIATVVAHRYRRRRWVPLLAYGAAAAVGFSRLSLSEHFTSDVFLGAVLGYSIARFSVLRY